VVLLFLGKTGPDVVLNEARDKDAMRDQGQRCEAQFYLGQHAVLENRQDAAREYFREAVKICPKGFIEYSSARAELE